jgi:molybdopterin molybdotransferase
VISIVAPTIAAVPGRFSILAAMREFFTVRTVAEVLAGYRPAHRTAAERVALAEAGGRVLVEDVRSPADLPGFARSSVDGFAVVAADTFGAGEGLPAYLTIAGAVRMGEPATVAVGGGRAAEIPTGAALPAAADAVVMVEHTAPIANGEVEVTRPVAPGDNVVRADEDARAGGVLARAGSRLRPQDVGLLAAAGVGGVPVHRRPVVGILSTGDEVVPPDAAELTAGRVRDANAPALAALVGELGGVPEPLGIVPDDPEALYAACAAALPRVDALVVSAGSSVGTRDATADVVARLGAPGIWCHGVALKPGKPTLLADVGGRPVVGLPGNPVSALVVFRLLVAPALLRVGGLAEPPAPRRRAAVLSRNVASATGRFDVVQVRLEGDRAVPLFGKAALLSVMTAADGFVTIPDEVGGLPEGADVTVECYA